MPITCRMSEKRILFIGYLKPIWTSESRRSSMAQEMARDPKCFSYIARRGFRRSVARVASGCGPLSVAIHWDLLGSFLIEKNSYKSGHCEKKLRRLPISIFVPFMFIYKAARRLSS